jgi:hypothetical protein
MKYVIVFSFSFLTLLTGCRFSGSGNVVEHAENVRGFSKIEVTEGFTVDVNQSDTFSIVVRIDDNLVEHLRFVKKGDTLKVGMAPFGSYRNITSLYADIAMPELTSLILTEGSNVTASGSAAEISVKATNGSTADLSTFLAVNAAVKAFGGSEVTVQVSGNLTAKATDGSEVYFLGNPANLTTEASNGSEIAPLPE